MTVPKIFRLVMGIVILEGVIPTGKWACEVGADS
jgi:hypothetical protein